MRKIFDEMDEYLQTLTWQDFALMKSCLMAMGILIGTTIPKKFQKIVLWVTSITFFVTYIPMIAKFWGFFGKRIPKR